MKIKGQDLAEHIHVLARKFNFTTISELHNWLLKHPKDEFNIKYAENPKDGTNWCIKCTKFGVCTNYQCRDFVDHGKPNTTCYGFYKDNEKK